MSVLLPLPGEEIAGRQGMRYCGVCLSLRALRIDAERSGVELQSPKFKHLSENELNILEFLRIRTRASVVARQEPGACRDLLTKYRNT